jgi:hypothetical protein
MPFVQVTTYKVMTIKKGTVRGMGRQETIPEQTLFTKSPTGSGNTNTSTPNKEDMMETW